MFQIISRCKKGLKERESVDRSMVVDIAIEKNIKLLSTFYFFYFSFNTRFFFGKAKYPKEQHRLHSFIYI